MKKRNLIISGEFTMTEVANADTQAQSQNTTAPKAKSAAARIAALKAAGVDVSNYFPMGEEMVVKVVDGVPVQVTDDDPVFAASTAAIRTTPSSWARTGRKPSASWRKSWRRCR